jgi:hypothetical protein
MFRHTFAHDWLAGGGSEGDLMELMGWHDRSMVDLYTEDLKEQRVRGQAAPRRDLLRRQRPAHVKIPAIAGARPVAAAPARENANASTSFRKS